MNVGPAKPPVLPITGTTRAVADVGVEVSPAEVEPKLEPDFDTTASKGTVSEPEPEPEAEAGAGTGAGAGAGSGAGSDSETVAVSTTTPTPTPTPTPPPLPRPSRSLLPAWLLESKAQLSVFRQTIADTKQSLSNLNTALTDFDDNVMHQIEQEKARREAEDVVTVVDPSLLERVPVSALGRILPFLSVQDSLMLAATSRAVRDGMAEDDTWRETARVRWGLASPPSDGWSPRAACVSNARNLHHAIALLKSINPSLSNVESRHRYGREHKDALMALSELTANMDDIVTPRALAQGGAILPLVFLLSDPNHLLQERAAAVVGNLLAANVAEDSSIRRTMVSAGIQRRLRGTLCSPDAPISNITLGASSRALTNLALPWCAVALPPRSGAASTLRSPRLVEPGDGDGDGDGGAGAGAGGDDGAGAGAAGPASSVVANAPSTDGEADPLDAWSRASFGSPQTWHLISIWASGRMAASPLTLAITPDPAEGSGVHVVSGNGVDSTGDFVLRGSVNFEGAAGDHVVVGKFHKTYAGNGDSAAVRSMREVTEMGREIRGDVTYMVHFDVRRPFVGGWGVWEICTADSGHRSQLGRGGVVRLLPDTSGYGAGLASIGLAV